MYLGLFSDRAALRQMFQAEGTVDPTPPPSLSLLAQTHPLSPCSPEEAHLEAGHFDSVTYLRLWSGDLEGALQLATERGELNDHLLSVAPMGTAATTAPSHDSHL